MIRLMSVKDYEKVYALWTGTKGMGMRSLDDSQEGIKKFLNRNPNTCYVYEEEGSIIGCILCGHDGRRAYIYHAAVAENYRRKGIGSLLLKQVYDSLEKEGINKAALVVFSNNTIGNSFWKNQGWEKREDLNYYNKVINPENK